MKVFYGCTGRSHYIMCRDFNEVYGFDMFGNLETVRGLVSTCRKWNEVDFISFVGNGTKDCEALCNGYKAELGVPLMSAIKPFRELGGYYGTIFNIPHSDDIGRFNQILFVYPKGRLDRSYVEKVFPNRVWNKL